MSLPSVVCWAKCYRLPSSDTARDIHARYTILWMKTVRVKGRWNVLGSCYQCNRLLGYVVFLMLCIVLRVSALSYMCLHCPTGFVLYYGFLHCPTGVYIVLQVYVLSCRFLHCPTGVWILLQVSALSYRFHLVLRVSALSYRCLNCTAGFCIVLQVPVEFSRFRKLGWSGEFKH